MKKEEQESYDFECVDCEHQFDVSDAEHNGHGISCPKCDSNDIIALDDEY